MHADLVALLALQELDRAVSAIEVELAGLEPELATLDAALAKVEGDLAQTRQNIRDAGTRRDELEGKIETYRIMQDRRRQRLEWVRGAKEAATLMAELDLARGVLAKEEAEWIRSADKVQEAERRAAEVEQAVSHVREDQAARREQIAAIQADCRERLAAARLERDQASRAVNTGLLVKYERIRRGKAPLAVYALHNGSCGQCFTAVPLQRRQQILASQSVINCEACGVLLYLVNE